MPPRIGSTFPPSPAVQANLLLLCLPICDIDPTLLPLIQKAEGQR